MRVEHMSDFRPTPYPEVNAALELVLAGARSVLGDYFAGMVLHGSLAGGDFNPATSDVDVLVVTTDDLPAEMLPALRSMHARITASGLDWATKMEVSYIPRRALRRFDPRDAQHPALRVDGSFDVDGHGNEWVIQRHVIRERGIALAGPDPRTLIDPIGPDDLRRAVRGLLREWWEPQLTDHSHLVGVAGDEYQAYAILTMCRMLYTFEHGAVVSKPAAARWAIESLSGPWAGLIEQALAWRHGMPLDRLSETLDFIRYTLSNGND
jgi:hypothetical protein